MSADSPSGATGSSTPPPPDPEGPNEPGSSLPVRSLQVPPGGGERRVPAQVEFHYAPNPVLSHRERERRGTS